MVQHPWLLVLEKWALEKNPLGLKVQGKQRADRRECADLCMLWFGSHCYGTSRLVPNSNQVRSRIALTLVHEPTAMLRVRTHNNNTSRLNDKQKLHNKHSEAIRKENDPLPPWIFHRRQSYFFSHLPSLLLSLSFLKSCCPLRGGKPAVIQQSSALVCGFYDCLVIILLFLALLYSSCIHSFIHPSIHHCYSPAYT